LENSSRGAGKGEDAVLDWHFWGEIFGKQMKTKAKGN